MTGRRAAPPKLGLAASVLAGACVLACASNDPGTASTAGPVPAATAAAKGALPAGVVARVGELEIRQSAVDEVAKTQKIPRAEALQALVRDAVFAEGARGLTPAERDRAATEQRIAHAAALLVTLREEAEAAGPVTDAELAAVTERHWVELDRPESFRTAHATIRFDEKDTEAKKAQARALADELHARVLEAMADPANRELSKPTAGARAADPVGVKLKAVIAAFDAKVFTAITEELPPVTADGRVALPGGGSFVPEFAAAASALKSRGDVSPVVVTPFGAQIVVLEERVPELRVPAHERRAKVRDEVIFDRGTALHAALLERLRKSASVPTNVDATLGLVVIEPPRDEAAAAAPAAPSPSR